MSGGRQRLGATDCERSAATLGRLAGMRRQCGRFLRFFAVFVSECLGNSSFPPLLTGTVTGASL